MTSYALCFPSKSNMEPQLSYIGEHVATCTNLFDISKEQSVCGIMAKVGFKTALGYTMFDTAAEDVSSSTRWLRRRLCWSCVGTGRDLPMCRIQVSGFPRKLQRSRSMMSSLFDPLLTSIDVCNAFRNGSRVKRPRGKQHILTLTTNPPNVRTVVVTSTC